MINIQNSIIMINTLLEKYVFQVFLVLLSFWFILIFLVGRALKPVAVRLIEKLDKPTLNKFANSRTAFEFGVVLFTIIVAPLSFLKSCGYPYEEYANNILNFFCWASLVYIVKAYGEFVTKLIDRREYNSRRCFGDHALGFWQGCFYVILTGIVFAILYGFGVLIYNNPKESWKITGWVSAIFVASLIIGLIAQRFVQNKPKGFWGIVKLGFKSLLLIALITACVTYVIYFVLYPQKVLMFTILAVVAFLVLAIFCAEGFSQVGSSSSSSVTTFSEAARVKGGVSNENDGRRSGKSSQLDSYREEQARKEAADEKQAKIEKARLREEKDQHREQARVKEKREEQQRRDEQYESDRIHIALLEEQRRRAAELERQRREAQ